MVGRREYACITMDPVGGSRRYLICRFLYLCKEQMDWVSSEDTNIRQTLIAQSGGTKSPLPHAPSFPSPVLGVLPYLNINVLTLCEYFPWLQSSLLTVTRMLCGGSATEFELAVQLPTYASLLFPPPSSSSSVSSEVVMSSPRRTRTG